MQTLDVRFFGEGAIQYNGQAVYLPYAKAGEVLFVLLHEKKIGRLRLCDLIWDLEECEEEKAKRNLRHAVYTIRKHTGETLIQSPKRETVLIDETCVIHSDLEILLDYDPVDGNQEKMRRFLSCYSGPFLQFCRSGSAKLEQWIEDNAQGYHKLYVDKLRQTIHRLISEQEYELAEQYCKRLLALEEYDEHCCAMLMQIYQEMGQYSNAIETYQNLEAKLEADLWVRPLPETTQVYLSVKRSAIQQKKKDATQGLYGRNEELRTLLGHFEAFRNGQAVPCCMISGEAGIGKTSLLHSFLKDASGECLVLNLCCYELEETFILRFWDKTLEMISNFMMGRKTALPEKLARSIARVFPVFHVGHDTQKEYVRKARGGDIDQDICSLFQILGEQYGIRILMAVDDLQWIDEDSLKLLSKVLYVSRSAVMLVGTYRKEQSEKLRRFQYHIRQFGEIEVISLDRFSQDKTNQFISQAYPEMQDQAERIYTYSEGNLLFLTEAIRNLQDGIHIGTVTDKMTRLVEGRILQLSENAQKLMAICAMFYDDVSVQLLTELVEFGESLLMDAVEELVRKSMMRESIVSGDAIRLTFSHSIIRMYVYDTIPQAKRVIMHGRIGKKLEGGLRGVPLDRIAYPKLIYHYERAENKVKLFEYKLKQMQLTFNVCHELFPVLETGQEEGLFDEYGNERLLRDEFKQLHEIYDDICKADTAESRELQILFLYLYGRFSNGSGNLPVAYASLSRLVELADEDPQYIQYSYRGSIQLIQYAINSNNLNMMRQNAERAVSIARQTGDLSQLGLAYRHFGYYYILREEFEKGEEMLRRAREQFELLGDPKKYRLHIAATFFFTGESHCRQGKFEQALECYKKTLELCNVEVNLTSTAVLYLRFGYIYYRMGKLGRARGFLEQSIQAYEQIIFVWGRADAYYYLHKVCDGKQQSEVSRKYRDMAERIMAEHGFHLSLQ